MVIKKGTNYYQISEKEFEEHMISFQLKGKTIWKHMLLGDVELIEDDFKENALACLDNLWERNSKPNLRALSELIERI